MKIKCIIAECQHDELDEALNSAKIMACTFSSPIRLNVVDGSLRKLSAFYQCEVIVERMVKCTVSCNSDLGKVKNYVEKMYTKNNCSKRTCFG